jgi:hypothetical protein
MSVAPPLLDSVKRLALASAAADALESTGKCLLDITRLRTRLRRGKQRQEHIGEDVCWAL